MSRLACAFRHAALAIAAATLSACGASPGEVPPRNDRPLERLRSEDDFPLYYAGERVDGLPLVAVSTRDDRARHVSFVYGDCTPVSGEGGCAPPVEIQVWPRDLRSLGSYDTATPGAPVPEKVTIRGLPAAFFEGGTRLELFVGPSTVVVFGDSPRRVLEVVKGLRCLKEQAPSLPRPPDGPLAC